MGSGVSLSPQAMDFAKLLADPYNAKLTHPVYAGAEGGLLARCEAFGTWGTGVDQTSGIFHWTPGAIGSTNTEYLLVGTTAPNVSGAAVGYNATPGKTFLTNNACAVRVVAACVTITYPGTELNRSGRVHYGHTSGAFLDAGNSTTVDQIAGSLEHFERTPAQ